MSGPTRDELLEAALSTADQPMQDTRETNGQRRSEQDPQPVTQFGPTLTALEKSRRPQAATVCEGCPNSVWFTSPVELRCYCRVMYLITWSSKEPQQLTACDGTALV